MKKMRKKKENLSGPVSTIIGFIIIICILSFILNKLGFEHVYVVPEQELPDGNFPTVEYPNPEEPKAYDLALKLAKKVDADIILATDPDSDRLGIHVKDIKTGEYIFYTGNMTALLIAEYILSQRKENGTLPKNGAVIKTIVSSNLTDAIAEHYKMHLIETLTGFKYIGEQIRGFEQKHDYEYVFGFEESYGCLVGTHARDKDCCCYDACRSSCILQKTRFNFMGSND